MKRWMMAAVAASALLAGCAAMQNAMEGGGSTGGPRPLLDQYVEADPFMILNCVYYGWSQLGANVETTGYDVPNTNRVKVYRGMGPDGKPVYDPILDIVTSGFGAQIRYTETQPGKLPATYQATVRRCMVPYAGGVD